MGSSERRKNEGEEKGNFSDPVQFLEKFQFLCLAAYLFRGESGYDLADFFL